MLLLRVRLPLRPIVLSLLGCLLIAGSAGCGGKPVSAATAERGGSGAPPVIVSQVLRKKVPLIIDSIGSIEPLRTNIVRSQVNGTLLEIAVEEGQDVREGDLLFEIDPRPFAIALQTAQADHKKVQVQLENAGAQVSRYRSLSTEHMVSREQFERIHDEARALEAELLAAESRVANARLQLEYCSIRAPLSGRTGNINVDEGDLVRANEAAALMTINQVSPINVTFGVPQQYLAAINRYRAERSLEVTVIPPGADEPSATGQLTFVDNAVDAATGTIRLKARFANADHRLWPGQFATVVVTLAEPEVLTVPTGAVQTAQNGQHVFVVTADNIAELREVAIERTFGNDAVVLRGLEEGETVVVDGQLRVVPGRSVDIKLAGPPAAPAGGHAVAEPAATGPKGQDKT
jgi:membrane fusion protein, multidrug efflux system